MIEKIWSGESPLWRLLLPLSWLYGLVSGAIRLCYKLKLKRAWRAPVPVVVVGNLTAGGNGKTPVVIWLVEQLQQRGIRVGVVSRGYGGKAESYPLQRQKRNSSLPARLFLSDIPRCEQSPRSIVHLPSPIYFFLLHEILKMA